jgi:hypothetical protein
MTDRTELERQIAELQAQLAALDAEPDWEAWRPALRAMYAVDGCGMEPSRPLDGTDRRNVEAMIAALPLAPRAVMGGAYSPAPKWVQDSIPDWAYERVAQLVGYGDKHGPRGSRAGVAFARYIADHEATLSRVPAAAWPGEDEIEAMAKKCASQQTAVVWAQHACNNAALEMARRLKAHMTGGAA